MTKILRLNEILSTYNEELLRKRIDGLSEKDVRFMLFCLIKTMHDNKITIEPKGE